MSHIRTTARSATVLALALLACTVALAACGSSSSSTATTAAAGANAQGAAGSRFLAFRECLQKNGVTLPKRSPGAAGAPGTPGAGGGFPGGDAGPQPPAGVSKATYEAAVKKCGGLPAARRGGTFTGPRFQAALASFAACMRNNGVDLPAPNTSGKGPVFNTSGLNATGAKFTAARTKCQPLLRAGFKAQPGAPAAAPPAAG